MNENQPVWNDDKVKVRSYGVSELGQMYNPELAPVSAGRALRRWIDYNTALNRALHDTGWDARQRKFTPLQVSRIFYYLGEP